MVAISALRKIGTLNILEKMIQYSGINIFDARIFSLARSLAIRHRHKTDLFPVYPDLVENYKATP